MERFYWIKGRNDLHISLISHFPQAPPVARTPVLVYCHGFTANKTGDNRMGVNLARALRNAGYLVVRFDYIGSGESEGNFETDTYFSGWLEDLAAVLDWLPSLEQADTHRIGLIGHSLGGALVTHFAATDQRIKAVCALAPVTHLERNFRETIIGPALWQRALDGEVIRNFYNKKYSLSPRFVQDLLRYDTLSGARGVNQPFLIVHGGKDAAVPVEHSYDLFDSLQTPDKNITILEQEEHLFTPELHPLLIEWFAGKL